jgi:hypothetical protein
MLFKAGAISYTLAVNTLLQKLGLHWLIDYIAANQKRVRKTITGTQEWAFSLDAKHRGVLKVYSVGRAFPYRRKLHFTLKFTVIDYTGPPVTLYLEDGVLLTEEERDAEI